MHGNVYIVVVWLHIKKRAVLVVGTHLVHGSRNEIERGKCGDYSREFVVQSE